MFKIGDYVKLIKKCDNPSCSICEEMLGKTFRVSLTNPIRSQIYFPSRNGCLGFENSFLGLVSPKKKLTFKDFAEKEQNV